MSTTVPLFTVAGSAPVDLNRVAEDLRRKITTLPSGSPLLAAQKLAAQSGIEEYLVVVRTNEDPHIHPDGDLVVSVLQGGGYFRLNSGTVDAPTGSVVVIPKGVCHAYFNQSPSDSVLVATFSPINSKAPCPTTA
jgi:mannose-6-phosphate isomerase-like protein (cupin superfamily)